MMKALILALLISNLIYGTAYAAEESRWVGPATIEFITVQPNSNIYVKLIADTPDLGCAGNAEGYLQLNPTYPNFKEQFSLLTAAHMAKREVRIYVQSCGHFPYAQNTVLY